MRSCSFSDEWQDGLAKHSCWSYQSEWRYVLTLYPGDPIQLSRHLVSSTESLTDFLKGSDADGVLPEYFDLAIDDGVFAKMELTLSLLLTAGNREIVSAIVGMYNPTATVRDSGIALK